MILIISGPSSVGKSTIINSGRLAKLVPIEQGARIVFPQQLEAHDLDGNANIIFHYNMLRPVHFMAKTNMMLLFVTQRISLCFTSLPFFCSLHRRYLRSLWHYSSLDPAWRDVAKSGAQKTAIVMVAPKRVLMSRAKQRSIVEQGVGVGKKRGRYDSGFWLNIYGKLDLAEVYKLWCETLERSSINYIMLESNDGSYNVIQDKQAMLSVVNS